MFICAPRTSLTGIAAACNVNLIAVFDLAFGQCEYQFASRLTFIFYTDPF